MNNGDVYPWDGSQITLILAYGCEGYTLHPVGLSCPDPALAFRDAYNEALARDKAAAEALLASV